MFVEEFNKLCEVAANTAASKGWKKEDEGTSIALMHSELSEALEYVRHGDPPSDKIPEFKGSEEELADVIIRIMHYAHLRKLDVAGAVLAKMHYNETRPIKHGGKLF